MTSEELQDFYENNKDSLIKLSFYECEYNITLKNFIRLTREVDISDAEWPVNTTSSQEKENDPISKC